MRSGSIASRRQSHPHSPVSEPAEAVRIVVDRDLCMGSGMCIVYAPGSFSHDPEAKVVVNDPLGDPTESLEAAVEACPTSALRLLPAGQQE
jgi:ferredoxin